MGLLIDRNKPDEDLYRPHLKHDPEVKSYGAVKPRTGRKYDPADRHDRYLKCKEQEGLRKDKILSDSQLCHIKNLMAEGLNYRQIHDEIGSVSYSTICKACKGLYE